MHQTETINKETSELKLRLQRSGNQQSQQQETFSKPAWIDTMTESCSNVKTEEKKKKKENSTERYLKDLKDLSVKFDLTPNLKVKLGLWWELTKQNERKVSRTVLQKSKAVFLHEMIKYISQYTCLRGASILFVQPRKP